MSEDTGFECPRCKRKGFVRLHGDGDIFECLYCRYTEDLGRYSWPGDFSWLLASLLGILVALAFVAV
ncbi:MAG: hypothetical protein F6K00_11160 [Leptolyngbya sp. SIOISBB]|nr:hypothetical protein [Leptolyngbya sp. SIOISBB]